MGVAKPIILMLDGEEIRPIPSFSGYYITRSARVISGRGALFIEKKPQLSHGYLKVGIYRGTERTFAPVHRLLMLAFSYVRGCASLYVDHINGNRTDNRLENLQWVTPKGNVHSTIKRDAHTRGTRHGMAKLQDKDVIEIRRRFVSGCPMNGAKALAKEHGVHKHTIVSIVMGRLWPHLPGARTSARAALAKHFGEESK